MARFEAEDVALHAAAGALIQLVVCIALPGIGERFVSVLVIGAFGYYREWRQKRRGIHKVWDKFRHIEAVAWPSGAFLALGSYVVFEALLSLR